MDGTELFISGGPLTDIKIGAVGLKAIVQNVRTILATVKGSVFLARHFGLFQTMVDDPMPVAAQKFIGEVVQTVEKYEPRVKVVRVVINRLPAADAADGKLYPGVYVKIRDGVVL